ncbi:MRPL2 [Candida oxycetoniae]|uniref:Large ribosomal subunit protein bL27m n=1 Tax=Candida oxycetoniae TaxID=497107 RepID=A0AAI9T0D2_9ASCO|nr:MRPL2 [Candida oxycetoniae]KAI3406468.2 MRPL2 [Candida oxycetoniae]
MPLVKSLFHQIRCAVDLKNSVIINVVQIRSATKRVSGSKTNNKDSAGRRLGPKVSEGHPVKPGQIIMRQRGTKIHPGENVRIGVDHTIYAVEPGFVRFYLDPFHPMRKYVGVALKKDIRLPKEHFAPRLRRFGYVPITDPTAALAAEAEQSRKESQLRPKLEGVRRQKGALRSTRIKKMKQSIANDFAMDLTEGDMELAAKRLVNILELVEAGETLFAARIQETYNGLYNLRLQYRKNELNMEEFELAKSNYISFSEKIDGQIGVSQDAILFKSMSETEFDNLRKELRAKLETLFKTEALQKDYRQKAADLIETPGAFNNKERQELRQQFLCKTLPYDIPGSVITDIDPKNVPENVIVQRIYNESKRRVETIGRPKEAFA